MSNNNDTIRCAEFKKQCDADIFKAVAPLLKKYQLEVDALTTRSKQAESAFMDIFKKLQDAPDPSPAVGISLVLFCVL